MRPLTSSDVTSEFLMKRPMLLLNAAVFDTRYVGSLLAKSAIRSKGSIALPPELSLEVFEFMKSGIKGSEYHLVRVLSATSRGESTALRCEVELSALTSPLAHLDSGDEVRAVERYLAAPDQDHDLSFTTNSRVRARPPPRSRFFSITVTNGDYAFLPHCLFYEITVPDIIAHLQDFKCWVCEDRRTICPGCTGGVAKRFDAFMGCGVDLACPLCLGLDFSQNDKVLLKTYYYDPMPKEEESARSRQLEQRLSELGY